MDILNFIPPNKTTDECYKAGFDAALNGANTVNCHFSFFSCPEKTRSWEEGQEDGKSVKGSLDHGDELSRLHG